MKNSSRRLSGTMLVLAATALATTAMAQEAPDKGPQQRQDRGMTMQQMDADGDGRVTAEELEAARQQMGQQHRQMRKEQGEGRGNGMQHGGGMQHHHGAPPGARHGGEAAAGREQRRAQRRAQHFARLDADGDGRISKAEFEQHHDQRFQALDADDDGVITAEEMSARQGMRDSRSK